MDVPNGLHGRLSGLFRSPKTILGFFAILIGILGLSIFGLTKIFAQVDSLRIYIPWLLRFGAGAFIFVSLAILITAWINPEKLMLGEVRGEVYLQMLRLRQGDSATGDVIEQIPIYPPIEPGATTTSLPSSTAEKEDDNNA